MPELPEVEAVRRELQPHLEGKRIVSVELRRPNLRRAFAPDFVERLQGRTVRSLDRRGKYLIAHLSSGDTLVMHLGMSGSFRVDRGRAASAPDRGRSQGSVERYYAAGDDGKHDHVIFAMAGGDVITFNDPRRFGSMELLSPAEVAGKRGVAGLGPEPLAPEFDAASLARACQGKKTSLKAALMDQRIVAGLGNIYVSEALHRAHLSPRRKASTIATPTGAAKESARALATAIKRVLADAIGYRTGDRFRVYDRQGERCVTPRCRGVVRRITQQGRSTFYCATCQK